MLACTKAVSIKWGNSNFASDSQPVSMFSYLKNLPLTIQMRFEQCRVVLVVCCFSDHKCRHGDVYTARCNATRKKTVQVIIISNYVPTGCNKCLIYNGFYCFCVIAPGHAITNVVRGVTFPSHA